MRPTTEGSAPIATGEYALTRIGLKIRPKTKSRGRRSDMALRAGLIAQSIKAYLMAKEEADEMAAEVVYEPKP